MDNNTNSMRRRPKLLRRLSSIELKVTQEDTPTRKGTSVLLSVTRASTFALVTSMLCAYAWFFVAAVGTSCLTASFIESTEATLLSLETEHLEFQETLEDIRLVTMLSRRNLDESRNLCLQSDIVGGLDCAPSSFTSASGDFL